MVVQLAAADTGVVPPPLCTRMHGVRLSPRARVLGGRTRSGSAGPHGTSVFNFLRKCSLSQMLLDVHFYWNLSFVWGTLGPTPSPASVGLLRNVLKL